ncbi:GNAT family N-acetyltransferase [Rhodococcus spelaei]|uniref:GNAT family N-acetyltransferase n=1 Tax=Rhodococcus spelaei TaxID=2546320 RepID=A0A541B4D9_9NOCA|nr:GNAT family N-acetyltransferase [Rhodococcus spelaei]TQF67183.1 GNAT family N-acetyltransferase [Rhodococcus spelaei]
MITIRPVDPADFDAVAHLTVDTYVGGGFVAESSNYVARLRDTAARADQAEVVVAEMNGEVVGSVTIAEPGSPFADVASTGELEFRMLAVSPDSRGKGAGSALVRHVLDAAYDRGLHAVVISTEPEMVDARRIYDRYDFTPAPDRNWEPVPGMSLTVLVREIA